MVNRATGKVNFCLQDKKRHGRGIDDSPHGCICLLGQSKEGGHVPNGFLN